MNYQRSGTVKRGMNDRRMYDTPVSSNMPAIDDVDMMHPVRKDDAVSEVIGAVLLISIVVIAVSIVGVILWSQPPPQKIPSLSVSISNSSCNVTLIHGGGDTVENTYIALLVDGIDRTGNFIRQDTGAPWTSWGNGETLEYSPSYTCLLTPQRVDVVYYAGTSRSIITSGYFGDLFSTGGAARLPGAPVSPDFTGTPLAGFVPFDVQFTGISTGSPLSWSWDFGDGGTSTLQSPSHTYTSAQSYTVSLTVNNGTGTSTVTKTNYIVGYTPPLIAEFTANITSGIRPLPVQFTNQSLGSPVSWSWVFGDGGTSTAQNPSYTYTTHGRYSVSLTVTNASAGTNSMTKTNYITVNPSPPWYCGWNYRKNITIYKNSVSGAQTNFPVLINLASDNDLKTNARSDGYDILFTASDGVTKLPHEIEKYNSGNGALNAWVNVPFVNSSYNNTIYMYYGSPSSTNQQNPTGVWDTSYKGVWHLKDDPDTSHVADSTTNHNNGTKRGAGQPAVTTSGAIGDAQTFDGTPTGGNDRINAGSAASIDNVFVSGGTVEAWIYPTGWGESSYGRVLDKEADTSGWEVFLNNVDVTGGLSFLHDSSGFTTNSKWNTGSSTIVLNQWNHVVVTFNKDSISNNPTIYINGASKSLTEQSTGTGSYVSDAAQNLNIGNRPAEDRTFAGRIDEVRISTTIRSSDWIKTEYNNQNSPATFHYVMGQEQWTC